MKIFLIPFLLCANAVFQYFCYRQYHLNPWLGGGFGMFSSSDTPGSRKLSIYLKDQEKYFPLKDMDGFGKIIFFAKVFPCAFFLERLIRDIVQTRWTLEVDDHQKLAVRRMDDQEFAQLGPKHRHLRVFPLAGGKIVVEGMEFNSLKGSLTRATLKIQEFSL